MNNMGSKYAGTETEKNLRNAFSGESEARNKYTYFASVAKKEGYEQIAALFRDTADNEKEHAKMWFKELNGIGDSGTCSKIPSCGGDRKAPRREIQSAAEKCRDGISI